MTYGRPISSLSKCKMLKLNGLRRRAARAAWSIRAAVSLWYHSKAATRGQRSLFRQKDTLQVSSMALSTMKHLLVTQKLRRGDGPFSLPAARRNDRLFGSLGRTSVYKSTWIKYEKMTDSYIPEEDTCMHQSVCALNGSGHVTNTSRSD